MNKMILLPGLVILLSGGVNASLQQNPQQSAGEKKPSGVQSETGANPQPSASRTPPQPSRPPLQGRPIPKSNSSDGLFDPYVERSKPNTPEYPPLEDRQNKYRELVRTARKEGRPVPNPSVQFLIDEVTVMGYIKIDGIPMVLCQSGDALFRMKQGDRFYNGFVRSIQLEKANREYDPFVKVICAEQVTPKKNAEKILVGTYSTSQ